MGFVYDGNGLFSSTLIPSQNRRIGAAVRETLAEVMESRLRKIDGLCSTRHNRNFHTAFRVALCSTIFYCRYVLYHWSFHFSETANAGSLTEI
jgi:hypothetical protein